MTGQQEAALWRLTGHKLLSLPPTGTSTPMLVFGQLENRAATRRVLPPPLGTPRGRSKGWTPPAETDSGGCIRSTWFTITALTSNASLKASLRNASTLDSSKPISLFIFELHQCNNLYLIVCILFCLLWDMYQDSRENFLFHLWYMYKICENID